MAEDDDPTPRPPGPQQHERIEGRGRTTIADRVLERLATRIALEVPGVVRHSTGSDLLGGSSLPSASAEAAGERVRVQLDVAIEWAAPAREVAAATRSEVRRRLSEVTGKDVDRVDVTVAALVPAGRVHSDRRRVQ